MLAIRLLFGIVVLIASSSLVRGQQTDQFGNYCEGHWQGGYCICPDGSLANGTMVGNTVRSVCSQAQYRAPEPTGVNCGDWTCAVGQHCSRVRYNWCISNDEHECSSGITCKLGSSCSRSGTMCLGSTDVDCGSYSCRSGYVCGSRNSCLAENSTDCGNGTACPSGKKCSRDLKFCLAKEAVDCGSYSCGEGSKCASGNKCLRKEAVDCGAGRSCAAGELCRPGGGCATRAQLVEEEAQRKREAEAKRAAAREAELERTRHAADEARRRRETQEAELWIRQEKLRLAEEKRKAEVEAKQRADQERREGERAARQREIETTKAREEERRRELARIKQEEEHRATEQRRQEDERRAVALAEAQKQRDAAQKQLAQERELLRLQREAKQLEEQAKLLNSQRKAAERNPTKLPSESIASVNPAKPPATETPTARTPMPNAGNAGAAANKDLKPLNAFFDQPRVNAQGQQPAGATEPTKKAGFWDSLKGTVAADGAILNSRPGQILTNTLAAAGGEFAKQVPGGGTLGHLNDAADLGKAALYIRQKDYLSAAQIGADKLATESSGFLGARLMPQNPALGQAVGKASAQFIIDSWKAYGAPIVGDELVRDFPSVFIPGPIAVPGSGGK